MLSWRLCAKQQTKTTTKRSKTNAMDKSQENTCSDLKWMRTNTKAHMCTHTHTRCAHTHTCPYMQTNFSITHPQPTVDVLTYRCICIIHAHYLIHTNELTHFPCHTKKHLLSRLPLSQVVQTVRTQPETDPRSKGSLLKAYLRSNGLWATALDWHGSMPQTRLAPLARN